MSHSNNVQPLTLTKTHHSVMNSIEAMDMVPAKKAQSLAFFPSDYICALPQSPTKALKHTQERGLRKITLQADEDFGLPFSGIPRLLLAKFAQLIKITNSREISLPGISQFCKDLQLPSTGKYIQAVKKQSLSLYSTHFTMKAVSEDRIQGANFVFIDNFDMKTVKPKKSAAANDMKVTHIDSSQKDAANETSLLKIDWQTDLIISESFFNHVNDHAFQVDYRALRSLLKSPLAMDIYLWLVYRLNAVQTTTLVKWKNLREQFGQGFSNDKHGRYRFKKAFMGALPLAHTHYPEANITPVKEGLILKRSRSNAVA